MIDEQLIAEVQQHGVIYNRQKYFLNNGIGPVKYESKEAAWQIIAIKLSTDVESCKKRWKYLRERYVQQRKQCDPPTYEHLSRPYLEKMKFLDQHIQPRKSYRNVPNFMGSPNANSSFGEYMDSSRSNGSVIYPNNYSDNFLNGSIIKSEPEEYLSNKSHDENSYQQTLQHQLNYQQQQQQIAAQIQLQHQHQQSSSNTNSMTPLTTTTNSSSGGGSNSSNNNTTTTTPTTTTTTTSTNSQYRENEVSPHLPSSSSSLKSPLSSPPPPSTTDHLHLHHHNHHNELLLNNDNIKKPRVQDNSADSSDDNDSNSQRIHNNNMNINNINNNDIGRQQNGGRNSSTSSSAAAAAAAAAAAYQNDFLLSLYQQFPQNRHIRSSEQLLGELVTSELLKMSRERRRLVQKKILEILFFEE